MVEMLVGKLTLFDQYARHSDVADCSPDAVDIFEAQLSRRVVTEEQERLTTELMRRQPA